LNKPTTTNVSTGRANTVLVFNSGGVNKAVVTSVICRVSKEGESRIQLTGTAFFTENTVKHILKVVLPVADNILNALKLPESCFEVSVVNFDAAAVNDIGLAISGFSADLPILLAVLSASLRIPVPEDAAFTGHIASADGDIRMVKGMPAKLNAVMDNGSIHTFYHPAVNTDDSLGRLSPVEKVKIEDTLIKAKRVIRTVGVSNVSELVQKVFSDEHVVLAGLKRGFYENKIPNFSKESAIGKAAGFFAKNGEQRFWSALERHMIECRITDACKLLNAFTGLHIRNRKYPERFGKYIVRLICSLPPSVRRRKLTFPLIPISECIKLSQFSGEHQNEDVVLMFKAVSGEKVSQVIETGPDGQPNDSCEKEHSNPLLESILAEINADHLTASIGLPIDSARAVFLIDSVLVGSHTEFSETIVSFYLHLLRHTRKVFDPVDMDAAGAEGFALLERAFSKQGGFQAALAEARCASNGGMRFVMDTMTEQLKREQQKKHVNHILKSALDPLDWQGKVNMMKELLVRLKPHLPEEIFSQPAERYAGHYEGIVETYVRSIDQVKSVFRSY